MTSLTSIDFNVISSHSNPVAALDSTRRQHPENQQENLHRPSTNSYHQEQSIPRDVSSVMEDVSTVSTPLLSDNALTTTKEGTISSPAYSNITVQSTKTATRSSPICSVFNSSIINTTVLHEDQTTETAYSSRTETAFPSLSTIRSHFIEPGDMNIVDNDFDAKYTHIETSDVFKYLNISLVSHLGHGASGTVYLGRQNSTLEQFAAKTFLFDSPDQNKNDRKLQIFRRETSILQALNHDNIVKLVYPVTTPTCCVLFLEYCQDGSLHKRLNTLTKDLVFIYFTHILRGVQYMHSLNVVHRDIKPSNLLVKDNRLLLTDFGLSQKLPPENNNRVSGCFGTKTFMAPEVWATKDNVHGHYDGFKADAFAVGVTLCCMILRGKPKMEPDCLSYLEKTVAEGLECDPRLLHCARMLLVQDAIVRADMAAVIDILNNS